MATFYVFICLVVTGKTHSFISLLCICVCGAEMFRSGAVGSASAARAYNAAAAAAVEAMRTTRFSLRLTSFSLRLLHGQRGFPLWRKNS
jgi:hypothetical protein